MTSEMPGRAERHADPPDRDVQPTGAFVWTQGPCGKVLRCRPLLDAAEHFFTTRELDGSGADYLWTAAAITAAVPAESLVRPKQVHGADVFVLSRGAPIPARAPRADAIVSNHSTVAIAVQVADCVPLLLADPQTGAVGAVHAGWRGTAAGVARKAVEVMHEAFGAKPSDLICAIGPSIGPCCYEVGEELRPHFEVSYGERAREWFVETEGELRLDLWRANRTLLEGAGLLPNRIYGASLCTVGRLDLFHSYRMEGRRAGRMAAVIRPTGPHERRRGG